MKLIDADAYAEEMKKRQDACKEWTQRTIDTGDEENYLRSCGAYAVFVEAKLLLENQPTIDVDVKHGEWIPCSERLPNGQTEVIVSCCDDAVDSKYNYTSFGWMTRDGEYWIVDNEINYYVNAWMPLPEPWRGAER